MSLKTNKDAKEPEIVCPYRDLYIYLIQGIVTEDDEVVLGHTFIGNWVEDDMSFLFFSKPAQEEVTQLLEIRKDLVLVDDYQFTYEQWQGGGFEILYVGPFEIRPPWMSRPAHDHQIPILLDPGVVFGNGVHPTTRDCLKALVYATRDKPFNQVLDLGTGTGVLALAAARLGAKKVLAVDLNPLCVRTCIRNVGHNELDGIIKTIQGLAEDFVTEPADLVMANIHYQVLKELFDNGCFRGKPWLILSGLMRSQAANIRSRLDREGMRLVHEWDHEMTWYTLLVHCSGF